MVADAFDQMWGVAHNIYLFLICSMQHYVVQNGFMVVRVTVNASQAPHLFVRCRSVAHN